MGRCAFRSPHSFQTERAGARLYITLLQNTIIDLKYAIRALRRAPAFAATALLTLALGIGANTAMFTVIRAVLLKPLPYPDPERLVKISGGVTTVRLDEMRAGIRTFPEVGDYLGGAEDITFSGAGDPEVLRGARVSANFLRILGVRPALGREFREDEDLSGGARVAMISDALWQRRFGGDRGVIGRSVTLAARPFTIVGVLPPGFQFPFPGLDVWITRPAQFVNSTSPMLHVFGRLAPGVSLDQANAELTVLKQRYMASHPGMLDAKGDKIETAVPLRETIVSDVRPLLWMLFGAVGFVLLIACANVASLLLARAASRSREFAVRAALGAGRGRLIAQLLTESVLLAFAGGILGVLLARLGLEAIPRMTALNLPRVDSVRLDGQVLAFVAGLSLLTGVLFGLAPSLGASRPDLAGMLRAHGEAGQARSRLLRRFSLRGLMVVAQVALSMVLLIGAALLMESLIHSYRVDEGYNPEHLLTMRISLAPSRYDTDQKETAFFDDLVRRVDALPGVRRSGVAWVLPMSVPFPFTPVQQANRAPEPLNKRPLAAIQNITPAFFDTMQIPLRAGRIFNDRDVTGAPMVVIIDEDLARLLWPGYPNGLDPVGQGILVGTRTQPVEVVGIVGHVRHWSDHDPYPSIYRPYAQIPQPSDMFAVRTVGDPGKMAKAVTAQVLAIDRDQPVSDVQTMEQRVASAGGFRREVLMLLGVFAGIAVVLAVVGLYGLIAYGVSQRAQEMGIRKALGAREDQIVTSIIGQGLVLASAGVAVGLGASAGLTRVMRAWLFQVSGTDTATYVSVAAVFLLVAAAASYLPARRAARIDPAAAVRRTG